MRKSQVNKVEIGQTLRFSKHLVKFYKESAYEFNVIAGDVKKAVC